MQTMENSLFVCYVPGLDRRRVDGDQTPHVHALLGSCPSVTLRTYPSTELLPTIITGVYPGQHRVWQVSLDDRVRETAVSRLLGTVPSSLLRTAQCGINFFRPEMELAAIPHPRRRRFRMHRFKYTRRAKQDTDSLAWFNGLPSIFTLVESSGYRFGKAFDKIDRIIETLPTPGVEFQMIECYAFDLFSHWNLDRPDAMDNAMRRTDAAIARMHQRCRDAGVKFVLLVDHGQEQITRQVNLSEVLDHSGVPRNEYTYLMEVAVTRLWFFTERAKQAITAAIAAVNDVVMVPHDQMRRYHVDLDASFGELYVYARHGCAFFPHDFYDPAANIYLGLRNRDLRARMWNPRHRGNHGHLPGHPSELGYMVVDDDRLVPRTAEVPLIDVAPTLLSLLGREKAEHMPGRPALLGRTRSAACA
jgi:hypothetical protein